MRGVCVHLRICQLFEEIEFRLRSNACVTACHSLLAPSSHFKLDRRMRRFAPNLKCKLQIREEQSSSKFQIFTSANSLDKVLVKQNHLIEAFNTTRPSLSATDIAKYQKTYAKFTNKDRSSREYVSKRTTLA
uniref:Uncharacterized protein n=1 Tax=Glossina austeni TaxID=7395 RepID=A0A1A9V5A7_GLOAU